MTNNKFNLQHKTKKNLLIEPLLLTWLLINMVTNKATLTIWEQG